MVEKCGTTADTVPLPTVLGRASYPLVELIQIEPEALERGSVAVTEPGANVRPLGLRS
jgi:hypothetical protein